MLTHRALALLRLRQLVPTSGRTWTLLGGALLYVAAWIFAGDTGATLALLCNVLLAIGAWDVYRTLGGLVTWRRLRWWQAVLVALLYAAGYLVPPVIILRGLSQAWRARREALAARPGQIAELEKDLGL
jgi:hypothetical protein